MCHTSRARVENSHIMLILSPIKKPLKVTLTDVCMVFGTRCFAAVYEPFWLYTLLAGCLSLFLSSSSLHSLHMLFFLFSPPLFIRFTPKMIIYDDMTLLCLYLLPSPGMLFVSLHLQQNAIGFPHLQQINITQEGSLDSILCQKLLQDLEWHKNVWCKS